jgi:hypothetical protein
VAEQHTGGFVGDMAPEPLAAFVTEGEDVLAGDEAPQPERALE